MTSRERLLTALRGRQPDRVPVTMYECSPLNDDWFCREPSYAPLVELERAQGDIFVWPPYDVPLLLGGAERHHAERRTEPDGTIFTTTTIDTPKGPLRAVSKREPSLMTHWSIEPFIKDDADVARVLSIPLAPISEQGPALRARAARLGDAGVFLFGIGDAIGHVVGLFDYEAFARRCVKDDGPIRALLEKAQELVLRGIRVLGGTMRDAVFRLWGPEYCGAPLLNPRIYFKRYVVEQDRAATELIHATGNLSIIHCHGRLRALLEMIAATGADGLEPIEMLPLQTADVTLADVKERIGDRLCLLGGMPALTLERGTPDDVRAQVRQSIAEGAAGGGFIFLPTSTPFMVPLTPQCLENARAYYDAVHTYGVYP